ncbi:hypothetical protein Tco_0539126, partial [Tanacetum coccineum]
SVNFEDVDDQQFIVHGSSSIGNKAVSETITNDAQNKDSDESTIVQEDPLTVEDQDIENEIALDLNNMDNTIDVSSFSTLIIHKNHPQS